MHTMCILPRSYERSQRRAFESDNPLDLRAVNSFPPPLDCEGTAFVSPVERFGHRIIEEVDELCDTISQMVKRIKTTPLEKPSSQYGKPDLHLIHP